MAIVPESPAMSKNVTRLYSLISIGHSLNIFLDICTFIAGALSFLKKKYASIRALMGGVI